MLAHHTSAGCGLAPGDLIGTGTLSSSAEQATEDFKETEAKIGRLGCLHELTMGGKTPLNLANNLRLTWLEDNDEITLEGWAGDGQSRIGFGQVSAKVVPAAKKVSNMLAVSGI
jgi:fumarylacetoacetase